MAETNDRSVAVAMSLARQVFEKRGNHSEAHLKESELAAIIALGIERSGQSDLYAALERLEQSARNIAMRLDSTPGNQISVTAWLQQADAAAAALAKARGEA